MVSFNGMAKINLKEFIKDNRVRIILTVLCFIPLLCDLLRGREYYEYRESSMIDARLDEVAAIPYTVGPDDILRQSFECTYEKLNWIALAVSKSGSDGSENGIVKLADEGSGDILKQWDIDPSMADENGWVYLTFDGQDDPVMMKDVSCVLLISGNNGPITVNSAGRDYYDTGTLTINGEDRTDDLFMIIRGYADRKQIKWVRMWICVYLALIVNVLWGFWERRKGAKA